MQFGNEFILIGAGLVAFSIIAGMFSSRLGAPLLLVFPAPAPRRRDRGRDPRELDVKIDRSRAQSRTSAEPLS